MDAVLEPGGCDDLRQPRLPVRLLPLPLLLLRLLGLRPGGRGVRANLADNAFLDHSARDYGYAVFGRVSAGMDVIDRIARLNTGTRKGYKDAPLEDVVVVSARRVPAA